MKIVGIDQSLAKCAMVYLVDGKVVDKRLSKTGSAKVKSKRKDAFYYSTLQEQIHHVCEDISNFITKHNPEVVVFESLSYASIGNATRDLASLYGAIREVLIQKDISYRLEIEEIAPTSLKTYARELLQPDDRVERDLSGNVVLLKSKKPKKVKMEKKLMVQAVREVYGQDYLSGYNYSTGLDDLADATLLALKIYSPHET